MKKILSFLLSAGNTRSTALGALRIVFGAFFIGEGVSKFTHFYPWLDKFNDWDIPWPGAGVVGAGVFEVLIGAMILVGLYCRPALVFAILTVLGAFFTAGIQDGMPWVLVQVASFVAACLLLVTGGGRWQSRASATSST